MMDLYHFNWLNYISIYKKKDVYTFFDMPWRKRKRKFNLRFIIYTKRVSNSWNSFKIPMSFPISRSHYRFKFRSTFTFYISPKFQQISLIHFSPSSLSRYQWNFSPRWISASFSKHNLIPLTRSRHLSNQTPITVYTSCTKINRRSSIRFASSQSGFIV